MRVPRLGQISADPKTFSRIGQIVRDFEIQAIVLHREILANAVWISPAPTPYTYRDKLKALRVRYKNLAGVLEPIPLTFPGFQTLVQLYSDSIQTLDRLIQASGYSDFQSAKSMLQNQFGAIIQQARVINIQLQAQEKAAIAEAEKKAAAEFEPKVTVKEEKEDITPILIGAGILGLILFMGRK